MKGIIERRVYWLLTALVGLAIGALCGRVETNQVRAEVAGAGFGGGGLITHFHEDATGGPTRVIVVDSSLKRMAVYHVPTDSGAIQLKSVRNLTVDLQIQEFNSGDPSPIDMQKTLQRN